MYLDVNVNDISTVKKDPTADIKQFYSDPFISSMDGHGKKKRRHCNICRFVFSNFLFFIFSHLLQETQKRLAKWPW
jgi:hypothetical protein